ICLAGNPSCTSVKARKASFNGHTAPSKIFRASKVFGSSLPGFGEAASGSWTHSSINKPRSPRQIDVSKCYKVVAIPLAIYCLRFGLLYDPAIFVYNNPKRKRGIAGAKRKTEGFSPLTTHLLTTHQECSTLSAKK